MLSFSLFWLLLTAQGDSATLLRQARRAQSDFEWTHRSRLPFGAAPSSRECDERIGRFCYWHDDTPDVAPPEPPSIGEARERLIKVLDDVAGTVPGDPWVAGQRVRYMVEAGRPDQALTGARACRAARWWCQALEAFALHAAGDFVGADSVYQAALEEMPAAERCRWTDISTLLENSARRVYQRLGCGKREAWDARLWWRAQPLLSKAGNDRRTEHFARVTMARLLEHAASPYEMVGGDDLTELIVRYGWPTSWSQGGGAADLAVVGHDRHPSYHFLPDDLAIDDTTTGRDATIARPRPQERYAPAYLETFSMLEPEFAAFRRGESTLVVAAYDLASDSLFRDGAREAALVLARDERTPPVVERRAAAESAGVFVVVAPWEPRIASLEVWAPTRRHAARARIERRAAAPSGVTLSDLLVFQPWDSLPQDLGAVLPHLRGSAALPRGSRIGLYWEVYGLPTAGAGAALLTSVSVVPDRIGWVRRAVQAIGLAARPRLARLEWRDEGRPRGVDGIVSRAVVLDLAGLAPGRYRIELAITPAGAAAASTSREIRVVAR